MSAVRHLGLGLLFGSYYSIVLKIGYNLLIRPEAFPRGRICTKFGSEVGVADVITCDNFLAIAVNGDPFCGGRVENRYRDYSNDSDK